jgi:hypothetical protein
VLRYVLSMALRGEITGMALCFRYRGHDQFAVTGDFKKNRTEGLGVLARAGWKVNLSLDAQESSFGPH